MTIPDTREDLTALIAKWRERGYHEISDRGGCLATLRCADELERALAAVHGQAPSLASTLTALMDRLENHYAFECEGGPLKNCVEWQQLRAAVHGQAPSLDQIREFFEALGPIEGAALVALAHARRSISIVDPEMVQKSDEEVSRYLTARSDLLAQLKHESRSQDGDWQDEKAHPQQKAENGSQELAPQQADEHARRDLANSGKATVSPQNAAGSEPADSHTKFDQGEAPGQAPPSQEGWDGHANPTPNEVRERLARAARQRRAIAEGGQAPPSPPPADVFRGATAAEALAWDRGWRFCSAQANTEIKRLEQLVRGVQGPAASPSTSKGSE